LSKPHNPSAKQRGLPQAFVVPTQSESARQTTAPLLEELEDELEDELVEAEETLPDEPPVP
jgi:hypothetical protein